MSPLLDSIGLGFLAYLVCYVGMTVMDIVYRGSSPTLDDVRWNVRIIGMASVVTSVSIFLLALLR